MENRMTQKVAVAMSGGVDSSLVTLLLKKQGYDVFGITMLLSDEGRDISMDGDVPQYISDARRVAASLGIEHHVIDLRDKFRQQVKEYFIGEYLRGRTPNPCVICNERIKFREIWSAAKALGADFMATGHYAQVKYHGDTGRYAIEKGLDVRKDQSYVLYRLSQDILSHLLLPLGGFTKTEVRSMAENYGLPVADKPESQEICFIPNDDYKAFLRKWAPESQKTGNIVNLAGEVLGQHDGVSFYTVGQRKGMGIAAPEPLYVVELRAVENQVVVGGADDVFARGLVASDVNWMAIPALTEPALVTAKVRYGNRESAAYIYPDAEGVRVEFEQTVRAVTPGQSVVFYQGNTVLGGGIIKAII